MSTHTFDHDDPEVLFTGAYMYRRGGVMVTALACIAFGVFFGYKTLTEPWMRDGGGAVVFGCFACVSMLFGMYAVYLWAARRELVLRVTSDGVEYGKLSWPWQRIAQVGGIMEGHGGVALTVLPQGATLVRTLATTPPMERGQFDELVALIEAYVAREHPHVSVDTEPHFHISG